MRTIRILFRLFRFLSIGFTIWRASRATRAFYIGSMLWKYFRRRSVTTPPRVVFTFVDPHTDAIYRRRGWRRIAKNAPDDTDS
ncbi:hypothetical protein [Alicyclobacillus acidiphilus]|uniref:hypothetical protein n=1 Tax=Alicyclobacillus acidiphilus TaxID=182455 RepID=UPI00082EECBE|nr:hypothetical protein [Alicyclobacillus acidiphilus]